MDRTKIEKLLRDMVEAELPDQLPLYDLEGPLFLSECLERRPLENEENSASMQFGYLGTIHEIAKTTAAYLGIITSVVGLLNTFGWINKGSKPEKVDKVELRKAWAQQMREAGLSAKLSDQLSLKFIDDLISATQD
ncbi:hypothetical protein P1X14_17025 [Sphingomonas sp. AOB5]|uniref:hypothetical protein n=1 Tax=Sphingomonas sp. AOB5 TaxID=3034017 RepID=UPI0023F8604A|nr:hypothetical protein [Sphingomonas sp. AOB5]MDF7776962.1 hypothetical protein [Sphingomonas sp. AOB5]